MPLISEKSRINNIYFAIIYILPLFLKKWKLNVHLMANADWQKEERIYPRKGFDILTSLFSLGCFPMHAFYMS